MLYRITDQLSAEQVLEVFSIPTMSYAAPVEASQNGSDKKLFTGGVRLRDGFYADEKLHFVHATDFGNGYAGIRYTKFDLNDYESYSIDYGLLGFDYAYPSISAFETENNQFSNNQLCIVDTL